MSPPRPFSKLSIISLSSFDTVSSFATNQFISYPNNTNNNKNLLNEKQPININSFDKKFDQTINQAIESFEQILAQCATPSNTTNDASSKLQAKKKHCEDFLRSLNKNRRIAKYRSKNRNSYGSTFYCRKALLQKPDGITYILVRKRFN
jgi:hypothetical protein